jgi:hypothetical protein
METLKPKKEPRRFAGVVLQTPSPIAMEITISVDLTTNFQF